MQNTYLGVYCTEHYLERAASRLGLTHQKAENNALRAYQKGKRPDDFTGKKRKYLDDISGRHDPLHTDVCVFGNAVYIFRDTGRCITVYPVNKAFMRPERPKAHRCGDDAIFVIAVSALKSQNALSVIFTRSCYNMKIEIHRFYFY